MESVGSPGCSRSIEQVIGDGSPGCDLVYAGKVKASGNQRVEALCHPGPSLFAGRGRRTEQHGETRLGVRLDHWQASGR